MRDLDYYMRLFYSAVGVALLAVGIDLTANGINGYYSVTNYYGTYLGQLDAQLHPSQYAQAFNLVYASIGIGIVILIAGTVILLLSIRRFMKLERKITAADAGHSDYSELNRIKTLFEQGEISREAYDMQLKRLQK